MSEAARESHDQFLQAWGSMVLDADPDADVRELPGITMRWADNGFAFWHDITLTDVGADADLLTDRLHTTAEIMRSKSVAGFLWLFEDLVGPRRPRGPPGRRP